MAITATMMLSTASIGRKSATKRLDTKNRTTSCCCVLKKSK
jgi:hypothetical protein